MEYTVESQSLSDFVPSFSPPALQGRYPGNDGTKNDTNNDDTEDSSNIALIVGGSVGALLVVALVVGFVFLIVVLWTRGKGKEGGGEFTDIRNPTYEG